MTTEIEWRRRWKPDLKSCPWQPVEIDGDPYLIKIRFTEDSYEILVCDLINFWYEEIHDMALKKRVQKLNPSIEASLTRILDQIRNSLESQGKGTVLSIGFKAGEDRMLLKINSQLAGMPFVWNFVGQPAENEMISENMTVPLMGMVGELTRRQRELIKIIQNKDKEIDDYKSQGVKSSRKHIETKEFVETAFENEMLLSKGFSEKVQALGSTAFDEAGQDLYRQIMSKYAWIHRSPTRRVVPVYCGYNGITFAVVHQGEETENLSDEEPQDGKASGSSWGTSRLPPSIAGPKSISPDKVSTKGSPAKSPKSGTPGSSPFKDSELLRRQALERRLEMEETKKHEKAKKKKKIAF